VTTTCPKCGYVRKPTDTVPEWECPSCNIAYAKYHAAPAPAAAEAPVRRGLRGTKRRTEADEDQPLYDAREGSPIAGVLFGAVVCVIGAYLTAKGFSVIRTPGRPAWWTDPGEIMLGATILAAGAGCVVFALDLTRRRTRVLMHAIWVCLATVLTWQVFATGFEVLAYSSIGPVSGTQFWRALVVAFDLYVLLSLAVTVRGELRSAPEVKRRKLAIAAGCIALAFTLELSGALPKVYAMFGLKVPGPAASIGLLTSHHVHPEVPDLRLADFAGDWIGVFQKRMPGSFGHGAGAIARVQVSVANGEARMQLWRSCPPSECDGGSYPAITESRRPGTVVALHAIGTQGGEDWIVSLTSQPGHLMLTEQRMRGKSMSTRRESSDWMERPKP
jgi:hypothetical protein